MTSTHPERLGEASGAARRLLALLVGLLASLALIVSGAGPASAQNAVGAHDQILILTVGAEHAAAPDSAGLDALRLHQLVSATGVAADTAAGGGARFTVDSSGIVVDATNVSGKLSFPSHLIPAGMTPNAYGNEVWGVGASGAKALIGTRGAAELQDLGLTVSKAEQWQDFYSNVYALNPKNAAAGARVQLMQNIITTLGGP